MRESIGGTWILQLVIVFILLFTAYLTLSLNYSKSFRVKNEVLSIMEREEGLTTGLNSDYGAVSLIANYLTNASYRTTGMCPTYDVDPGWIGATSLDVSAGIGTSLNMFEIPEDGKEYYYCVKKISGYYEHDPQVSYYKLRLFFQFDLPFLGTVGNFVVTGQTTDIEYPQDTELWARLRV